MADNEYQSPPLKSTSNSPFVPQSTVKSKHVRKTYTKSERKKRTLMAVDSDSENDAGK